MNRVEGSMREGYLIHLDGPLSLFSATTKYGMQMANFLPAILLCQDYRLNAEILWGPKREIRTFHLDQNDGLVSHYHDTGTYIPAEVTAFAERFRQVVPALARCNVRVHLRGDCFAPSAPTDWYRKSEISDFRTCRIGGISFTTSSMAL